MIEIEDVSKQFDRILALDGVSAQIEENCIFGLVGTNGAGKSTLLRIISGVLHPDHGQVRIDGYPVWENPRAKGRLCFLADTAYFFANATPRSMGEYYRVLYPGFDSGRYEELLERFELDPKRKLSTFSKGMKKQLSVAAAICLQVSISWSKLSGFLRPNEASISGLAVKQVTVPSRGSP